MLPQNRTPFNAVKVSTFLVNKEASIAWLRTQTTEELLAENIFLTGFSRFTSLSVILAYFICGMIEKDTGALLGYKCNAAGESSNAVASRMRRIAEEIDGKFYTAFYILRKAGHIEHPLKWELDPTRRPKQGHRYGTNRRNISVGICKDIVARNHGNKDDASKHTGVPVDTIKFWLKLGYKK